MTEHLKNLISEQDGDVPDSAVNTPSPESSAATPASPPASLSSVITEDSSPADPVPDSASTVAPAEATDPAAFNLRDNLQERLGIDAGSYADDNAAFEDFASALGQASTILNDESYHQYQEQQEAFQAYLKQQSEPDSAPSAVAPEQTAAPASSFATAQISEDAQLLAQQNLITRSEDGTWTPKQPAFQSFADEYNKHDIAVRTNVMKFSQDPTGFVNKLIEKNQVPATESDAIKSMQEQLAALQQQLADQAALKSSNEIQKWRDSTPLKNANGTLTPYAKEYMRWESRVRQENPGVAPEAIHQKVISSLNFAGVTPESATPATEAKKPAEPRETMASKAKRRAATNSNGNGHNRLKEFAASAPASAPGVPTGKAGLPSLNGIIAQSETSLTD